MPRIEIELTSSREDGSWTWRAVGAREPRGSLDGALLTDPAAVGDVLRVETDQFLDGMTVTAVLPPRDKRSSPVLLELLDRAGEEPGVTTRLVGGRRRRDHEDRDSQRNPRKAGRSRGDRGRSERKPQGEGRGDRSRDDRGRSERKPQGEGRGDRSRDDRGRSGRKPQGEGRGDRSRDDRGRSGRKPQADRGERSRKERGNRTRRDDAPAPPKTPRLRPRRTHRNAAVKALPDEQRLVGRILLDGGVPGLRSEIARQNEAARSAGQPEIPVEILLTLGERLQPGLHAAEWRDRAEAAEAGLAEVDLRDLRSVVVAAESGARGDEARSLAERLRSGLAERVEREHEAWLLEVARVLGEGRVVRALRLSSRPPKAGAPMPRDLLDRLAEAAAAGMTADTGQDRWGTMLDAVASSPVHKRVVPAGLPAEPGEELLALVRRFSLRVPAIAAAFGVEPAPAPTNRRRRRTPAGR
ncbi:MAG: hypothetical protein P6D49_05650 [Acidimicrobiales bacterium]|nr:hypothetical protein [Acidimicrobiales bacterium]